MNPHEIMNPQDENYSLTLVTADEGERDEMGEWEAQEIYGDDNGWN